MRIYTDKTQDEEFNTLAGLGYGGTLNEKQFAVLRNAGYTGTLSDMMKDFIDDGSILGAVPFAATTYTGNGSTQSIVNDISMSTDGGLVWIKNMDQADSHVLVDTARGATKVISSDTAAVETTDADTVTGFNANGFDIGADVKVNTNSENYIAWAFLKSAGFFDVVTYTGDGIAGRTVSHAIGSAPGAIFLRRLDFTSPMYVYHKSVNLDGDGLPETDYLILHQNSAAADSNLIWYDTAPDASSFTVSGNDGVNKSGSPYVAYLFAHDPTGNIQCGGYTGNGSATGPTISLGKRPKWVMIKRWDSPGDWVIYDDARDTSNPNTAYLLANSSAAEAAGLDVDFNATGFQIKTTGANVNANTGEYIYIAVTE